MKKKLVCLLMFLLSFVLVIFMFIVCFLQAKLNRETVMHERIKNELILKIDSLESNKE